MLFKKVSVLLIPGFRAHVCCVENSCKLLMTGFFQVSEKMTTLGIEGLTWSLDVTLIDKDLSYSMLYIFLEQTL